MLWLWRQGESLAQQPRVVRRLDFESGNDGSDGNGDGNGSVFDRAILATERALDLIDPGWRDGNGTGNGNGNNQ